MYKMYMFHIEAHYSKSSQISPIQKLLQNGILNNDNDTKLAFKINSISKLTHALEPKKKKKERKRDGISVHMKKRVSLAQIHDLGAQDSD